MERDLFHPEGHDRGSQHRGGDPAHPHQPEAGGTDLPDVPGCAKLRPQIREAAIEEACKQALCLAR